MGSGSGRGVPMNDNVYIFCALMLVALTGCAAEPVPVRVPTSLVDVETTPAIASTMAVRPASTTAVRPASTTAVRPRPVQVGPTTRPVERAASTRVSIQASRSSRPTTSARLPTVHPGGFCYEPGRHGVNGGREYVCRDGHWERLDAPIVATPTVRQTTMPPTPSPTREPSRTIAPAPSPITNDPVTSAPAPSATGS